MNVFPRKRWLLVGALLTLSVVFIVSLVIVHRADCTIYCSPVIQVMNYQQFSELLKNMVKTFMISRLKASLAQKLSISYTPGSFVGSFDSSLLNVTDFSSMINDTILAGLQSQINFVNSGMSVSNFTNAINNAATATLDRELKKYRIDRNDISTVLTNYQKALNSQNMVGTYAGPVAEYQSMVSEFLPAASHLTKQMTGLSGKMDVSSSMALPQKDVIENTRQTLGECTTHARDGLTILGNIANMSIGDSVKIDFASSNGKYLKVKLGRLGSNHVGRTLTDNDIEKIIVKVNNAAAQTVPQYILKSTNTLFNGSSATTTQVATTMKLKVQSALTTINKAAIAEKARESAAQDYYSAIEKDVAGLVKKARNYEVYAREEGMGSLFEDSSMKKMMVLLAKRESSETLKRLGIKHYILARTSLDIAINIGKRLKNFNPASIDAGYEDQAWKDIARFQYYLVHLENQQLKLAAIQAMIQASDIDDPDVLKYVESVGFPGN